MFFSDSSSPEDRIMLKGVLLRNAKVKFPFSCGLHMKAMKNYKMGEFIELDNIPKGATFKFDKFFPNVEWVHSSSGCDKHGWYVKIKPIKKYENLNKKFIRCSPSDKAILTSIPDSISFPGNSTSVLYKDLLGKDFEELPKFAKNEIYIDSISIDGDFYRELLSEVEEEKNNNLNYMVYTIIKTDKKTGKREVVATSLNDVKARVLCEKIAKLPGYEYSILEYVLEKELKIPDFF